MLKNIARTTDAAQTLSVDKLLQHARLPLYRNAYALIISTVATSALGMVYWIVATRYYPPESVGINAAVISMMTFLAGVAQLPSMNAMLRYIPVAGLTTKRLVVWAYLFSTFVATAIGVLFLFTINLWSPTLAFLQQDLWLALWFVLGVVTWCIFALQDNVLTGMRQAIYVPLENVPYAIAKIVLLMLFATSLGAYGILASWTLPLIVILVPINYLIFKRLMPRHMEMTKEQRFPFSLAQIAYYVAGNSVGALFMLAATRLLPVLVANLAGASATAFFYLPWTIATSLKLIIANTTTSFTVEVAADPSKLRAHTVAASWSIRRRSSSSLFCLCWSLHPICWPFRVLSTLKKAQPYCACLPLPPFLTSSSPSTWASPVCGNVSLASSPCKQRSAS